jgi:TonB family protein
VKRAHLAARLALAGVLRITGAHAQGAEGQPSGATPVSEGQAALRLTKPPKLVAPAEALYPGGESRAATVTLALTIGADGRVLAVEVRRSGGERFDEAAVEAAGRLLFDPAFVNGRPAAIKITYSYTFTPPAPAPLPSAPTPSPAPIAPAGASLTPSPAPSHAAASAPAQDIVARGARRRHDETEVTVAAAQASKVVGTQGDPIKVLENLPGLSRPSFGSGQIIVWGAAPGETRTYVDGVEVPALFHGSALRSTVNGDLVRDVTLTPGAYGADYGRAIGGMVRVETKDLPAAGVHEYAGVDTLDGSALVSAALGDRVRVAVAGRYGWLDSILPAEGARNVDEFYAIPRYGDYQAKLQVRLRDRESLDAVFLASDDALTETIPDPDPARVRSETTRASYQRFYLRYRRELEDGARIDVSPWVGHDGSDLDASFGENPATLGESTWRWGLRASHRSQVVTAGPREGAPGLERTVTLTWGIDLDGSSAHVSRSGSLLIPPREGDITVFGQPPGSATNTDTWTAGAIDVAPYVVADIALGPLSLSPALRADGFLLQTSRLTPRVGETPPIGYQSLQAELEPRVAARLRITSRLSLLCAAGVYSQAADPADLSAVFGNPTLGLETADHASLGESLVLTPGLSLEVMGFYKWMSGLAVRDPSPTPKLAAALLQEGVGRAYGVQMLLRQQPWHGFFGWLAYTMSRSEREDTPGAGFRLFDYDQPQVLTIVGSKELGAWTVGARFRYATGLPRTPVTGAFYDARDDTYQPIFGAQNSVRLPDFWQLDLRVDRSFSLGEDARLLVYVEGLNVTNRANGEEYIYNVDYSKRGTVTGLPAIAVVGVRVEL